MAEQHSSKGIMWTTIIVAIVLIAIIFPLTNRIYGSAADASKGGDEADVRIQPVARFELAKAEPVSDGKPKEPAARRGPQRNQPPRPRPPVPVPPE